jgi:hypothetical protein
MGRKRKVRILKPWEHIMNAIVDLQEGLKIYRASRDYYNVTYIGSAKELRKICTKILNVLDNMEQEKTDGSDATTGG